MSLLGKDWNVVAVTFERAGLFRINGNRGRGNDAVKMRDNARKHARSVYWAVFDQKGRLLEGEPGPGRSLISASTLERLLKDIQQNESLRQVLATLEAGKSDKAARPLVWDAGPEPPKPITGPHGTYTLLIKGEDDQELESGLRLEPTSDGLSGVMVSPDGDETPIHEVRFDMGQLTFEIRFEEGATPPMVFRGRVLETRRVIKGGFE